MRVYFIAILVATFNLQITMELEASLSRQKRSVSKPYYFGTTHLMCMLKNGKKGKRSAPSRYTLQLDHRFIYYDGWYFEFGIFGGKSVGIFNRMALASDRCPIENREASGWVQ
uniref:Uncharacterized protein n=1 Tax=Pinctada fucata TaxID=50426 RepID=A0A194ALC0_PINFU